jgi:hypothetical protein
MRLDLARSPVDWVLLVVLMIAVVAYPRVRPSTHPAAGSSSSAAAMVAPTALRDPDMRSTHNAPALALLAAAQFLLALDASIVNVAP